MKNFLLLTLAFLSINLYGTDFTFSISGKQYKIIETKKSWTDAAAWAVQDGGYLVEIGSAAEQNGIVNAIAVSGISTSYTVVNDGGGIAYIWIGATDKNTEGTWIWDGDNDGQGINFYTGQGNWGAGNGAAVGNAYFNWGGTNTGSGSNEPDDYGSSQDAAGIGMDAWPSAGSGNVAGEWNDINKSNTLYFIVEYDATSIDESIKVNKGPSFTLFQNTNGVLNIKSESIIEEISIYNMEGKQVFYAENVNSFTYMVGNLPSTGVYFVRSRFENAAIMSKKVFIQ